jgi:hypothetical protein
MENMDAFAILFHAGNFTEVVKALTQGGITMSKSVRAVIRATPTNPQSECRAEMRAGARVERR